MLRRRTSCSGSASGPSSITSVPPIGRCVHSTLGHAGGPATNRPQSTRGTPPSSSGRTTTRCWAHCGRRRRCTSTRPVCGPSPATRTSGISAAIRGHSARAGGRWSMIRSAASEDGSRRPFDPAHGPPRALGLPGLGQSPLHAPGAGGVGGFHPGDGARPHRRRPARRRDRLRRRAQLAVSPDGDRRDPGHRRRRPAGFPPMVRRRHRVARPPPRRDHGRARASWRASSAGTSRRSERRRVRTWSRPWCTARSTVVR